MKQSVSPPEAAAPATPPETAGKPTVGAAPSPGATGEQGAPVATKPPAPATAVQADAAPPKPTPPAPEPAVTAKPQPAQVPIPASLPLTAMSSTMMSLFVGGALAFVLLMIAAQWKIFEKAGVAGWKCLIPIYNMYVLFLIAGKPGWWLILMLVPIVSVVVYLLAMLSLAGRFSKGPVYGVGLFLLPFIFFPLMAFDGSEYSG